MACLTKSHHLLFYFNYFMGYSSTIPASTLYNSNENPLCRFAIACQATKQLYKNKCTISSISILIIMTAPSLASGVGAAGAYVKDNSIQRRKVFFEAFFNWFFFSGAKNVSTFKVLCPTELQSWGSSQSTEFLILKWSFFIKYSFNFYSQKINTGKYFRVDNELKNYSNEPFCEYSLI